MICPFRVHTKTVSQRKKNYVDGSYDDEEVTRTYEPCHGDECPFYYIDENDVPKCAKCNGPEEEEIL